MITIDTAKGNCKIQGDIESINKELTILTAHILHELVIPMGIDPEIYVARQMGIAVLMSKEERLFNNGNKTVIMIPRKEDE